MAADLLQQALDIAVRELRSCLEHFHVVENHGGVLDVSHVLKQIDDLLDARRAQPLAAPATTTGDDRMTYCPACLCGFPNDKSVPGHPCVNGRYYDPATPPAAPAAVTEQQLDAAMAAYWAAPIPPADKSGNVDKQASRGYVRAAIQAALAAAASAGMGE